MFSPTSNKKKSRSFIIGREMSIIEESVGDDEKDQEEDHV